MRRPARPRPTVAVRQTLVPLLTGLSLAAGALGAAGLDSATPAPATPAVRTVTASENPLAGRPWGTYLGRADQTYAPYLAATGTDKQLLGRIALAPKAKWFGGWISDTQIAGKVKAYVANAQAGNPEALVQLAVFRMRPWEHEACRRLPTTAEQASYKRWVRGFAAGVGSAHTAVVLQPDGPFALCAPGGSTLPSRLIAYSAKVLGALPHTSVYIDVGAADWESEAEAVQLLLAADVADARGFALNLTHYDSTARQISFGAQIVSSLAHHGVPHRHFVINTAENGRPFKFLQYYATRDRAQRPVPCTATRRTLCATLGIPPTSDVANPRWNLPAWAAKTAAKLVDGYLWMGRPWLNISPFSLNVPYALALARSTPF